MDNFDLVDGRKLVQKHGVMEGWDLQKEYILSYQGFY